MQRSADPAVRCCNHRWISPRVELADSGRLFHTDRETLTATVPSGPVPKPLLRIHAPRPPCDDDP